jgi:hypothetical protein
VDAANALTGTISGASDQAWQVSIWSKGIITNEARESHLNAFYVPWEITTTTGLVVRGAFQYEIDEAVGVALFANPTTSTVLHNLFLADPSPHRNPGLTGDWMHMTFSIQQAGGNCNVYLNIDEVEVASAVWTGVTIGAPSAIRAISEFGAGQGTSLRMQDIYISQLTIHNGVSLVAQQTAGLGFPGELASDRIARVCAERGIPVYIHPGDSEPLGPQPPGGDLDVLRDAELSDMGILYERGRGLAYRPRVTRYNQTPALVIDLETYQHSRDIRPDQVLSPTYDDKGTRNDVTASRRDGSSARVIDSAHATRHGVYDDSVELGVATDDVLPSHAGWRVHLGTWEEMRYPSIPVDLAGIPKLIDGWLSLSVGDRVIQTNVPAPHPSSDVDQLVAGMSHTLTRRGPWTGQAVGYPARPWDVATADGDQRVPADGSTSAVEMLNDADDLIMEIANTTQNGDWVVGDSATMPDDFPLLAVIGGPGGEVVEIAEIEAASGGSQTAYLSQRGVNGIVRAWAVGVPLDVHQPAIVAL